MCVCVLRLKGKSIFVTTIQPIYIIMSEHLQPAEAEAEIEEIVTSDLPVPEAIALTQ